MKARYNVVLDFHKVPSQAQAHFLQELEREAGMNRIYLRNSAEELTGLDWELVGLRMHATILLGDKARHIDAARRIMVLQRSMPFWQERGGNQLFFVLLSDNEGNLELDELEIAAVLA